jgi:Fe-S-cluster containining protein
VKISLRIIQGLLDKSTKQRIGLRETYALVPASHCRRKALCCTLLPEISLVEALAAIQCLSEMNPTTRLRLIRGLVRYFFLNSVRITSCPFLADRNCLIYQDRFFGCRAYGLWSKYYYDKLAVRSQQMKWYNQEQWQNLGISLPQEVVDFQVPYCPHVKPDGDASVDDETLPHAADKIEILSKQLTPWHESFRHSYFSDLSFLLVSLAFGLSEAVQMKFAFVKDYIATGNQARLSKIIKNFPDVFAVLT